MIYRFDGFTLDTDRAELTAPGGCSVTMERQVYLLLKMFVEAGDRLLTRDAIVGEIWNGRAISDAAISSRISSARAALGDDGQRQRLIRTVHGQGFRFVGKVEAPAAAVPAAQVEIAAPPPAAQPSIAVLPFLPLDAAPDIALMADALPHELILQLSRLRWLLVIARGSTFRFRSGASAQDVGQVLDARYVLSGTIESAAPGFAVSVVLEDNETGQVCWAERYALKTGGAMELKAQIAAAVVSELDVQIPLSEALKARHAGTEHLDAWSNYHLGLYHMYRFTAEDNAQAKGHFERALALDPRFARAHAGLSFTRFQDAFAAYQSDLDEAKRASLASAERAIELDPRDPFANFALGRYYWLEADMDRSAELLQRAVALNPNYAQGLYSLGFAETLAGYVPKAAGHLDLSLRLSPLDPLAYGMLGSRSLGLLQQGRLDEAMQWGERAARSPGAHFLIAMIATALCELGGETEKAAGWAREVKARRADASVEMFLRSFPFRAPEIHAQCAAALKRHGF